MSFALLFGGFGLLTEDGVGGGEDVCVSFEAGAERCVAFDLVGGELGCAGLDLGDEDPPVMYSEDVGFGFVVGAEPYVDPWQEMRSPALALQCCDGQEVGKDTLVTEQVQVTVEPVIHGERGSGLEGGWA